MLKRRLYEEGMGKKCLSHEEMDEPRKRIVKMKGLLYNLGVHLGSLRGKPS